MIMFHYVYVLKSLINDNLYIGMTDNLKRRLWEHNHGLSFSTKPYMPWQIIHFEGYINKKDSSRREKYLKTNQGSRLLKRMLKEYFYENK